MKRKTPSRKDMLQSCQEIRPDDGLDPRTFYWKRSEERKVKRKDLQLCREVARTLNHALAWEIGDELLSNLQVEAVLPAPNASRLLALVSFTTPVNEIDVGKAQQRLEQFTGRLRAEVAAAIHRRRVPELTFRIQASGSVLPGSF